MRHDEQLTSRILETRNPSEVTELANADCSANVCYIHEQTQSKAAIALWAMGKKHQCSANPSESVPQLTDTVGQTRALAACLSDDLATSQSRGKCRKRGSNRLANLCGLRPYLTATYSGGKRKAATNELLDQVTDSAIGLLCFPPYVFPFYSSCLFTYHFRHPRYPIRQPDDNHFDPTTNDISPHIMQTLSTRLSSQQQHTVYPTIFSSLL